jgi:hypothetical protein
MNRKDAKHTGGSHAQTWPATAILKACKASATGEELLEGYSYIQQAKPEHAVGGDHTQQVRAYRMTKGVLFKRRPFISSGGYVGLVPSHSEPGDLVCVLPRPVVLCRRRNGRGYTLVGEAYVHNIMDGEFVQKAHEISAFDGYGCSEFQSFR